MKPIDTIYLDMDGIASNFVDAVGNMYGVTGLTENWKSVAIANRISQNTYDIAKVLKISTRELRNSIEAVENFWVDMKEHKSFGPFYNHLKLIANVPIIFLTSPPLNSDGLRQKVLWLQNRYGRHFRDWILCPARHKEQFAQPGKLLIDDSEDNCLRFQKANGLSIVFPRHWNSLSHLFTSPQEPYNHVIDLVKQLEFRREL